MCEVRDVQACSWPACLNGSSSALFFTLSGAMVKSVARFTNFARGRIAGKAKEDAGRQRIRKEVLKKDRRRATLQAIVGVLKHAHAGDRRNYMCISTRRSSRCVYLLYRFYQTFDTFNKFKTLDILENRSTSGRNGTIGTHICWNVW